LEVFAPRQFAILPAPILLAVLAFCLTCALVWLNVVQALAPAQVAVLVNKRDPNSVSLGEYYLQRRGLAPKQLFAVELPPGPVLDPAVFARVYRDVTSSLPAQTQALALAWTYPYRVGCMSVTTAFTAGYDPAFCATAASERARARTSILQRACHLMTTVGAQLCHWPAPRLRRRGHS
jgi:hypothetical protein